MYGYNEDFIDYCLNVRFRNLQRNKKIIDRLSRKIQNKNNIIREKDVEIERLKSLLADVWSLLNNVNYKIESRIENGK